LPQDFVAQAQTLGVVICREDLASGLGEISLNPQRWKKRNYLHEVEQPRAWYTHAGLMDDVMWKVCFWSLMSNSTSRRRRFSTLIGGYTFQWAPKFSIRTSFSNA
jgi:hypothetical protein